MALYDVTLVYASAAGMLFTSGLLYVIAGKFDSKLYLGIGFLCLGVALAFLGFWDSDFAFFHVEFGLGDVGVPFVGTFKPGELWNLGWFTTSLGILYCILGSLILGQNISRENNKRVLRR